MTKTEKIEKIQNPSFNSYYKNHTLNFLTFSSTKFTIEIEKWMECYLFLDLLLKRKNGILEMMSVYRKRRIFCPRYIPTDSYCPIQYKKTTFKQFCVLFLCQSTILSSWTANYNIHCNIKRLQKRNNWNNWLLNIPEI